jgi:hypothetical protein
MNYFLRPQILNRTYQLSKVKSYLDICKSLSSFKHVIETKIRAELKDYINIVFILKVLLKKNNPLMIH